MSKIALPLKTFAKYLYCRQSSVLSSCFFKYEKRLKNHESAIQRKINKCFERNDSLFWIHGGSELQSWTLGDQSVALCTWLIMVFFLLLLLLHSEGQLLAVRNEIAFFKITYQPSIIKGFFFISLMYKSESRWILAMKSEFQVYDKSFYTLEIYQCVSANHLQKDCSI